MTLVFLGLLGFLICLALLIAKVLRQEAPAREAIGLLACAAAFVVGCIGLNSPAVQLAAGGGLQALGDVADASTALLSDRNTQVSSEGGETKSLDELCAMIDETIGDHFTGIQVTNDGRDIRLAVWLDGLAQDLTDLHYAGGDASDPAWVELKSSLVEMAGSARSLIDTAGHQESRLYFYIMNDLNSDRYLFSILDSTIMFDLMENVWPE